MHPHYAHTGCALAGQPADLVDDGAGGEAGGGGAHLLAQRHLAELAVRQFVQVACAQRTEER